MTLPSRSSEQSRACRCGVLDRAEFESVQLEIRAQFDSVRYRTEQILTLRCRVLTHF